MKKILFAIVAGLISALALTNESYAQVQDDMASTGSVKNYYKNPNSGVSDNSNPPAIKTVNTKALQSFKKLYKVNDARWVEGKDCITATYFSNSNEIDNIIYFDKKGHWTGSVKLYKESLMPKEIRKLVKREYYDYEIVGVQELESIGSDKIPTYIVIVEDEQNVKQLRIYDGNMEVFKEFKKS